MKKLSLAAGDLEGYKLIANEKKEVIGGYRGETTNPIGPDDYLCQEGWAKYSVWGCSQTGWSTACLPCTDSRVAGHPDCANQIVDIPLLPIG